MSLGFRFFELSIFIDIIEEDSSTLVNFSLYGASSAVIGAFESITTLKLGQRLATILFSTLILRKEGRASKLEQ